MLHLLNLVKWFNTALILPIAFCTHVGAFQDSMKTMNRGLKSESYDNLFCLFL